MRLSYIKVAIIWVIASMTEIKFIDTVKKLNNRHETVDPYIDNTDEINNVISFLSHYRLTKTFFRPVNSVTRNIYGILWYIAHSNGIIFTIKSLPRLSGYDASAIDIDQLVQTLLRYGFIYQLSNNEYFAASNEQPPINELISDLSYFTYDSLIDTYIDVYGQYPDKHFIKNNIAHAMKLKVIKYDDGDGLYKPVKPTPFKYRSRLSCLPYGYIVDNTNSIDKITSITYTVSTPNDVTLWNRMMHPENIYVFNIDLLFTSDKGVMITHTIDYLTGVTSSKKHNYGIDDDVVMGLIELNAHRIRPNTASTFLHYRDN